MKVVIAIDSFKGSISSLDAGAAIREGIHRVFPEAEVLVRPLADGGEGTVEALARGMNGRIRTVTVTGPLGTPVEASYGILDASKILSLESAEAPPTTAASVCFRHSDTIFWTKTDSRFPSEPAVCHRLQRSMTHTFSRNLKIVTLRLPAM